MKKQYEKPQAKLLDFTYTETVAASNTGDPDDKPVIPVTVCEKINDSGNGIGCGKHPQYNNTTF